MLFVIVVVIVCCLLCVVSSSFVVVCFVFFGVWRLAMFSLFVKGGCLVLLVLWCLLCIDDIAVCCKLLLSVFVFVAVVCCWQFYRLLYFCTLLGLRCLLCVVCFSLIVVCCLLLEVCCLLCVLWCLLCVDVVVLCCMFVRCLVCIVCYVLFVFR